MAVLFVEGFDHYNTNAFASLKWDFASLSTYQASGGRFGGGSFGQTSTSHAYRQLFSGASTIIAGGAFKYSGTMGANDDLMEFRDGGSTQVTIESSGLGQLRALNGFSVSTVLGVTDGGVLIAGQWHWVEVKVFVSNTVGTVEIRIDGKVVMALTNVDTSFSGGTEIDIITFEGGGFNGQWDDIYISDLSGSAPQNDFLGDGRVDTLYPDGDGNYTEFGTTTGTPHSDEVNENPPDNSGASVITSTAANQRDTFTMDDLAVISDQTIFAVQQTSYADYDVSATSFRQILRRVADHNGGSVALSASRAFHIEVWNDDPQAAAAWTETNVNATESGVESL